MKTTHARRVRVEAAKAVPRSVNPLTKIPAAVRAEMRDRAQGLSGVAQKVAALIRTAEPKKRRPVRNVFCPTGQGGGIDPTCSPKFVPHEKQRPDETTVILDADKLDAAWLAASPEAYIPRGGGGAEIAGRRANVEAFIRTGKPFQASRGNLFGGGLDLQDGRHRFSVLRDRGLKTVAVTVPKAEAAEIVRRYG